MTVTGDTFTDQAKTQIGIFEDPPDSNRVKFSIEYGLIGPWCAMFVWWVALKAGAGNMKDLLTNKFALTQAIENALYSKGLTVPKKSAKRGMVALFQFDRDVAIDHIGIVDKVTAFGLWCIEGNTSPTNGGSQSNGGLVARRFRPWSVIETVGKLPGIEYSTPAPNAPQVHQMPIPDFSGIVKAVALAKSKVLRRGDSGDSVKWLQMGLNNLAGTKLTVDGDFGPSTEKVVEDVQRFCRLTVDGVVGPKTWAIIYP